MPEFSFLGKLHQKELRLHSGYSLAKQQTNLHSGHFDVVCADQM